MNTDTPAQGKKSVSVVCRTIGRPQLNQAIDSLLAQTYPFVEIVLVEAIPESLNSFNFDTKNLNLKIVSRDVQLPRAEAANIGLESATGDYLMFLDDDDWVANDHISNLVNGIETDPRCLAAYCGTQKTDAGGELLEEVFNHHFDRQLFMRDNYIPIHAMLFSNTLLEKGCRFDSNFEIFEDWDFWLQLLQHTDFIHIDKITAFYRDGGGSDTASGDAGDRYSGENAMALGRAKLFAKWLKIWPGSDFNALIGSMDHSAELKQMGATIASLNADLHKHHDQIHELSDQLGSTSNELMQTAQKLHETNLHADALNQALKHVNQTNEQLNSDLNKANQTNEQVTHENNLLVAKITNLKDQLSALSFHAQELDAALRGMLNSTSWKLMGPFRRSIRMIRSLTGNKETEPLPIVETELSTNSGTEIHNTNTEQVIDFPVKYSIDVAFRFGDSLFLRGWACSAKKLDRLQLNIGEDTMAVAYGLERDDIAAAFPELPGAIDSGFIFLEEVSSSATLILEFYDEEGLRHSAEVSPNEARSLQELSQDGEFICLDLNQQYFIHRLLEKENPPLKMPISNFSLSPLISIIVPVYNVERVWLDACIASVVNQTYKNWELCLHDDSSTNEETLICLREWAEKDPRIKVQFGEKNLHISGASNLALEIANGEFIGLMDNDDELDEDALYWVINALNENPNADYFYTDEDKIDETGKYCEPHFKPKWSPELLESMMYVGHFGVIRRKVMDQVGGFRMGLEGSQDYDLTLRIASVTHNFVHIPKVLYHWRIIPGSVSGGGDAKGYAYDAAVQALSDYSSAQANPGAVTTTEFTGLYRIQREVGAPRVAIIMPFHNKSEMTIDCLRSIENSSYENYEILLISNNSNNEELTAVADYAAGCDRVTLEVLDIPFNWSAINNWGAAKVEADYLLFINNDMTIITEDWIESLLSCGIQDQVGVVGCKLLYEDDSIQHGSIIMEMGGTAGHAFKYLEDHKPGYFGYAAVIKNCTAVTGACMLVRKSVFSSIEGFNEDLGVAYNDVDFCLRLREAGYRNVYTPFAKLYHLESKTRPKTTDDMNEAELRQFERESAYIKKRHAVYFDEGDPFFSKAFTLKVENYTLKL